MAAKEYYGVALLKNTREAMAVEDGADGNLLMSGCR